MQVKTPKKTKRKPLPKRGQRTATNKMAMANKK